MSVGLPTSRRIECASKPTGRLLTLWRTRNMEHCRGAPSILCGFHDTESARESPLRRDLCVGDSSRDPPQQALGELRNYLRARQ